MALSGGTDGVSDPNAINETYSYDPWGNMQRQGSYNFLQPFSAHNQISASGYSYDSAGDLLTDGIGDTYTYSADGRLYSEERALYLRSRPVLTAEFLRPISNKI